MRQVRHIWPPSIESSPLPGLSARLNLCTRTDDPPSLIDRTSYPKNSIRLSVSERLEPVEELWDSIPEEDEALALTPEQREDLDLRLAEAGADPDGGVPGEEARERIRQRHR